MQEMLKKQIFVLQEMVWEGFFILKDKYFYFLKIKTRYQKAIIFMGLNQMPRYNDYFSTDSGRIINIKLIG